MQICGNRHGIRARESEADVNRDSAKINRRKRLKMGEWRSPRHQFLLEESPSIVLIRLILPARQLPPTLATGKGQDSAATGSKEVWHGLVRVWLSSHLFVIPVFNSLFAPGFWFCVAIDSFSGSDLVVGFLLRAGWLIWDTLWDLDVNAIACSRNLLKESAPALQIL
ncbi:hypothetical protein HPP92_009274 [Vanilla planifolia]|uniref:Uncharacterized protein n=1 Tax=Vanilla planifolia TaxID=51239 RepID=A0A835R474_VANPL|nr:hypothetical protein HPP92_009274 [Vanilla planifolia]